MQSNNYIDNIFTEQFIRDILWSINCVYEGDDGLPKIEYESLSVLDRQYLTQIAEGMEYGLDLEQLTTSSLIRCEMGRLFAYYILGNKNQESNSIINTIDLNRMYTCFSLQKQLKITYCIFGGVKIIKET